ncbi:MAG: response regulator [Thermodesulfobacteriota bacterium]
MTTEKKKIKEKIMVVDDEIILAEGIKCDLEELGYNVPFIALTADEAIKGAEEYQPDLILMDIMLKGEKDGIMAAEEINKTRDVAVVYLTAYSDDETLSRAKVTEPYGYIVKPYQKSELHSSIEMALYKHKMERRLKEEQAKVKTLSGLLPICASCKKIRDSKGYWKKVETYIEGHSEAEFTHGICPACQDKMMEEAKDL